MTPYDPHMGVKWESYDPHMTQYDPHMTTYDPERKNSISKHFLFRASLTIPFHAGPYHTIPYHTIPMWVYLWSTAFPFLMAQPLYNGGLNWPLGGRSDTLPIVVAPRPGCPFTMTGCYPSSRQLCRVAKVVLLANNPVSKPLQLALYVESFGWSNLSY